MNRGLEKLCVGLLCLIEN